MNVVGLWWRQPDHYDWLSGWLASRGLQSYMRLVMAASTVAFSSLTASMMWSPAGPVRPWGQLAAGLASACCIASAFLWVRGWPTRRQSAAYAVIADAGIATAVLSYAEPLVGLIGCITFATLGGYIAFFHTARLQLFNIAVATATTLTLAIEVATLTGDVVVAVCTSLVITVALVSFPLTSQSLVHFLGGDLLNSDLDPLCGLLNRRAFYRSACDLLAARNSSRDLHLAVTMVDLDHFKQLNDAHGHAVGDRALITVGEVLRRYSRDSAVVARVGGEEFLVADVVIAAHTADGAEQLRNAIAQTPFGITASVGVASAPVRPTHPSEDRQVLDDLICTADAAMYEAKRAGGNQVRLRCAAQHPNPG